MTPRPGQARRRLTFALALSLSTGPAALAAAPVPTLPSKPTAANVENEPVRFKATTDATGKTAAAPATVDAAADLWHVVVALLVVVALIFGLRWVARRFALVPSAGGTRAVRVLSRTVVSPRQQVLLLQVGRRIVVVGDGGAAGMRSLAEITDPDEVAALIGDAKAAAAAVSPARSFNNLFRRASEPYDAADPPVARDPPDVEVPGDVAGLLDKVRGLRQQFDR